MEATEPLDDLLERLNRERRRSRWLGHGGRLKATFDRPTVDT